MLAGQKRRQQGRSRRRTGGQLYRLMHLLREEMRRAGMR